MVNVFKQRFDVKSPAILSLKLQRRFEKFKRKRKNQIQCFQRLPVFDSKYFSSKYFSICAVFSKYMLKCKFRFQSYLTFKEEWGN